MYPEVYGFDFYIPDTKSGTLWLISKLKFNGKYKLCVSFTKYALTKLEMGNVNTNRAIWTEAINID